ncbi:MAG: lytic transglycosylase domain-containing protein [Acidobacteria bacterium]|nr:lytic transglycosylase domain-containing protein [Acidobacteriota bacterium]MBV9068249.1 lytic transglycosylase domain-containing protein [Acidobacteriota bacterium]MBV9185069.1 lytic transglycosylase domain-containing protein [Acidobacteriota bacterium]
MKKRVAVPLIGVAAVVLLAAIVAIVALRQRAPRHRVFRAAPAETRPKPPSAELRQPNEWSEQFRELEASGRWSELDELLERIAGAHPNEYSQWSLAYLHARALIENNEPADAAAKLAPYLAAGNPFRDLALYHQAEIDDARGNHADASRNRQALIFAAPSSLYRDQAIDEESEHLSRGAPKPLIDFATKLFPTASTSRRRDLTARIVESTLRAGDANGALARGIPLLQAGTLDDASDRASRALDQPALIARMNGPQLLLMGESMQNHRHFDRAVALLSAALRAMPQRREDLTFAIGRSYFGNEQFAEAQKTYLRGAASTAVPKWKATFLWHAARAAQLQGDDRTAETLMTQVLGLPGRFDSTGPAVTQRIRTRLKQRRFVEAAADLAFVRKNWPNDHTLVEASLAYALGMLGAGNNGAAVVTLNAIPRNLLDKFEPYEIDYWRARALESSNPPAAFAAYLNVLRATQPTHFAYFARQRLDAPAMQPKLTQALATRDAEVARLIAAGNWLVAKQVATDRILLSSTNHVEESKRLAAIYEHLPEYANILNLQPEAFPQFPLANADRASLLMAMGLYDEAADNIPHRYPLRPLKSALTQSLALNRGNASKESIFAIEVLMNSVPRDYVPELLPLTVRQLLYPRYFYDYISEDSKSFNADPTLVLAIMREESRFNPRAKSEAAARGLLQFIITTARQIGRDAGLLDVDPEDLYDPRVIIRLGAKYISTLSKQFANDHYNVAASYNAGPKQTALWSRLAPAPGDDYFLSAINFDETKQYVRKVMNSYKRYEEIYGNGVPSGGIRPEP